VKQLNLVDSLHSATTRNPVFARHETFHPRFGWIKKGFDAVVKDPEVFLRDDAPVRLGIGKNMARSIRYWCSAFKMLKEDSTSSKSRLGNSPSRGLWATDLGSKLLSDEGWDPFLEDPTSLWLLHWNLLKPPCYATAWELTFNHFRQLEFSAEDLFLALCDYRENLSTRVADSSLKKDITCILRMYAEQDSKARPNEETLDCPFTELGLIYGAGDSKRYLFQVGSKGNLPDEMIVAAALEFSSRVGQKQRTIALSRLAFDADSPGLVFKLSESAISEAIEKVACKSDSIRLEDTAGLIQLSYTQDPAKLAEDILDEYYRTRRGGAK